MNRSWIACLWIAAAAAACATDKPEPDSGAAGGDGGGGDGGGDGGGGDGGGGDGGGADLDCDAPPPTLEWDAGSCIAAELQCGDSVVAQNTGGPSNVDGGDYSSIWACEVTGTGVYTGPEQHFAFDHPGTGDVTFTLDSPCADLDLFVMRWESDTCVTSSTPIFECEGDIGRGGGAVTIWQNAPARYVVIVEGEFGETDPYRLDVACP
jgi:hypothetical protein